MRKFFFEFFIIFTSKCAFSVDASFNAPAGSSRGVQEQEGKLYPARTIAPLGGLFRPLLSPFSDGTTGPLGPSPSGRFPPFPCRVVFKDLRRTCICDAEIDWAETADFNTYIALLFHFLSTTFHFPNEITVCLLLVILGRPPEIHLSVLLLIASYLCITR